MNCLTKDELIDYFFSKTPSAGRADMEEHFAVCGACRAKMETLKRLQAAAASITPAPVSAGFTDRLIRNLKTRNPGPAAAYPSVFNRGFRPARALAMAAFAAALYLGAFFLSGPRAPRAALAGTLYFSDGPATVNNTFPAQKELPAAGNISGQQKAGYLYTDNCAAARCGIL